MCENRTVRNPTSAPPFGQAAEVGRPRSMLRSFNRMSPGCTAVLRASQPGAAATMKLRGTRTAKKLALIRVLSSRLTSLATKTQA